jgi:ribosomal protein L37AE/L43A
MRVEVAMAKNFPRTGKKVRPKTAVKGKRYLCAKCRKRSPKPVKTPAPWYCPNCLKVRPTNEGDVA